METHYDHSEQVNAPVIKHTQFLDLTNGEGGDRNDDGELSPSPSIRPALSTGGSRLGNIVKFDPSTPGRVVETGLEHTGRWTKEEHESFLTALQMYGKEWKKVAAKVKTRTVVQTRTHAQKYFQKLAKVVESGKEHITSVEMGVAATEARRQASAHTKKQKLSTSAAKAPRQATSVASAAHLISNLSSGADSSVAVSQGTSAFHMPGASMTTSPFIKQKRLPAPVVSGANSGLVKPSLLIPHGFSSYTRGTKQSAFSSLGSNGTGNFIPPAQAFSMKITAPGHDAAMKRGKFPEPSPAACGKRKLAEIAAARMLAGVAAVGDKPLLSSTMEDGTATPPPEEETKMKAIELPVTPNIEKMDILAARKPMGLSLQIVNPESLGVSYDQQKQRNDGQTSPVTPWEGDIKALMR
jgi:SHAQKYF class myb-like DNA-binding protein